MRLTMFDRLRAWREISAIAPAVEDPEAVGGRQAEQFLNTLVQSHLNFQGASLFPNKRVPAGHRRREIDLIVVTAKRIHVIEVKNWSGTLRVVGGRWVQTNRSNREIAHPDLVADHQDKNLALIDYLRREGVSLDPRAQARYLSNKVIFMNPRLVVNDRAIVDHPDVLLHHRLSAYLDQQRRPGLGERILGSVIQWCLDSESAGAVMDSQFGSLSAANIAAVRAAIDRLATWDSLHYHGARVETGDLLRLSVGGAVLTRQEVGGRCSIPVRWTRHRMWGFLKALTGLGHLGRLCLPGGVRPLSTKDYALFHRAGEPSPVEVPLLALDGITLG